MLSLPPPRSPLDGDEEVDVALPLHGARLNKQNFADSVKSDYDAKAHKNRSSAGCGKNKRTHSSGSRRRPSRKSAGANRWSWRRSIRDLT